MNHYHFPDAAKIWQNDNDPFGIKPHLDSGIFTLLMSDGSEGLERCINRKVSFIQGNDSLQNKLLKIRILRTDI